MGSIRRGRRGLVLAAAALAASAAVGLAVTAVANTAITITSGACAGGGTQYCFTPESASGQTGAPVTWTNSSGVNHTVTSCDATNCPGAPANTGTDTFNIPVNNATSNSYTFSGTGAGNYTYYCTIHGYAAMHGAIAVSAPGTSTPEFWSPGLGLLAGAGVLGLFWYRRRRRGDATTPSA